MVWESMLMAAMLAVILVCAFALWLLREPFCSRYSFRRALTLVIYSFSPLFLCQLLGAAPRLSLWFPWLIGICFTLRVLYYGLPRMVEADPGHAFGLFIVSAVFAVALTAVVRFLFIHCINGGAIPVENLVFDLAALSSF